MLFLGLLSVAINSGRGGITSVSPRQLVSIVIILVLTVTSYKKPYISFLILTIVYGLQGIYSTFQGVYLYNTLPAAFIFGLALNLAVITFFVIVTRKARQYEPLTAELAANGNRSED